MSASHHLAVVALDESGGALNVSSMKLTAGSLVSRALVPGGAARNALSGLNPGKHELRVSFSDRPDFVFPLSLVKEPAGLAPSFAESPPACCPLIQRTTEGTAGATKVVFTLTITLAKTHSEVILVAGWDYSGGANNVAYCESYRDDLSSGTTHRTGAKANITKRIDNSTVVTFFDFKTGIRLRMVKGSSGWFEMDGVLQGTVNTHLGHYKTSANVRKRYLDDSISIKHVYDYIITLGAKAPASLREFHIFSHAWAGGPILVETYEDAAYDAGGAHSHLRDPHDKDPRIKDFDPSNMPRLKDFKAAFAPNSIAKIWGCMATHAYRNLIRAAAQAKNDADTISFDWDGSSVSMTAAQAKKYLQQDIMGNTYMARLSAAIGGGTKVYGAPPGMGADLRTVKVGKKNHNYMYVNSFTYKREYDFLRKAFKMVPDDTGYIPF
jgi:hypothetical protein